MTMPFPDLLSRSRWPFDFSAILCRPVSRGQVLKNRGPLAVVFG